MKKEDKKMSLTKKNDQKYSLKELLSKVTPDNIHEEVNSGKSVGREKW